MHEVSLVQSLLRQTEQVCDQHNGIAILKIEVEIGALSGVEPELIRDAFKICSHGTRCGDAEFVVHEVALKALCRECDKESELVLFQFRCVHCGSRFVRITQGEEFRLINVTIVKEPSPNSNDAYTHLDR